MKKNFFKKLSFVLALAMVVSVVAPAASAFAAAAPKLNSTKKYLHLDVDGANEYDFNIKNKQTGWKYLWESSNEDVVVVNKNNGVATAAGVGTAKVIVNITNKKGAEVAELRATVVVRDNIKTVSIANKPEGDKLAVGKDFDFNRNFVTLSGNTKKTSAITRWSVEPADGATIDNSGVFVATKAGEYTVTARAFQSTAKYTTWKANPAANTALELATASYKLTVAASIVDVKQVDADTITVNFDSAVADLEKNLTISQMVGTTKVKQTVKKVAMSDDKKTATVDLYLPLTTKATYVVDVTGMDSKTVDAATANAEDVVSIEVIGKEVVISKAPIAIGVKLLNKDGVELSSIDKDLLNRVSVKGNSENNTFVNENAKTVAIYAKDATAVVTATYHTRKYDNTGKEIGAISAQGTFVGVSEANTNVKDLNAWTIVKIGTSPNFGNVNQKLSLDQADSRLYVKLNMVKGTDNADAVDSTVLGNFKFTSSDSSILIVDPTTGNLYPVKEGSTVVVVSYGTGNDKTPVATIAITVGPKAAASETTLNTYNFSLSNAVNVGDTKEVKLTVTDQLGRKLAGAGYRIEAVGATSSVLFNTDTSGSGTTNNDGEAKFVFNGATVAKGQYNFKVTVNNISKYITVQVNQPDSDTVAYYKLQLNTNNIDLKTATWSFEKKVDINLYGYAPNGVANTKIQTSNPDFYINVEAPTDNSNEFFMEKTAKLTENSYALTKRHQKDDAKVLINKAPIGSYNVVAYQKLNDNWTRVDSVGFTVTDSQVKAIVKSVEKGTFTNDILDLTATNSELINAVKAAFKFSVNGAETSDILAVKAVGTTSYFNVINVVIREYVDGASTYYIEHTVPVGVPLSK